MKKAPILFFLSFFLFNFSFPQHPQWDWAKSFGSIDSDVGNAICSDKFGNIYITGYYNNSITFGNNTFTSAYYDNPFVVKLNSEGNIIWAKAFYGSYFVRGYDICCDTTCNVYVSGIFNNIIMKDISCIVGITLLIGSLSMTLQKRNTDIFNKFYDLLDEKQIYWFFLRQPSSLNLIQYL